MNRNGFTREPEDAVVVPNETNVGDGAPTLARLNVIEINNMTSNMTSLEVPMSPELN